MSERKRTKMVWCGSVPIGGGAPVAIQSMTTTDTCDVQGTIAQITALEGAGCHIVRVAVPNAEAAGAIREIKKSIGIPLVADIHFDYRLALEAMDAGADKVRINPGNIGGRDKLKAVAEKAKSVGVPVRIGVNGGSLERELLDKYGGPTPEALSESAIRNERIIRDMGFEDLVISIKSSDPATNLRAHRLLSDGTDSPLHIGITEAGFGERGIVKSAVGIGALLLDGIGDTIRVSLTGDPVQEIAAARHILSATGLLPGTVNVISCPTCGRCKADLARLASEISRAAEKLELERSHPRPITIAVMGCAVNGPGEASHADIGVALGVGNAALFSHGRLIRNISLDEVIPTLISEMRRLA